jgi:hypothetical protein
MSEAMVARCGHEIDDLLNGTGDHAELSQREIELKRLLTASLRKLNADR